MEPDDTLPLLFSRPADLELLQGLGPFVVDVVRTRLWEYSASSGALFHVATVKVVSDTIVVTFVTWPGTPIVLEVRESGFHHTALARLLASMDGTAAEEVRLDE
jgi:hypothetical protein